MLTADEWQRYDRQILIKEIGEEGQEKLKRARVLVAGAGGLGSPIGLYLAAAGIGMIRIVDHDTVDLSNLNRQILHGDKNRPGQGGFGQGQTGHPECRSKNRGHYSGTITEDNINSLIKGCDLIVDAMDNLPTRYILNKAAIEKGLPFFHGAVRGLEGRAMTIIPGKTPCLRCMYHGDVPQEKFPVIGVTPAVIGSIQATEVIKYLVGTGELLSGRLLIYDGMNMEFREFKVSKNPQCEHCGENRSRS